MSKTGNRESVEEWLESIDPEATPARDATHLRDVGKALSALEQAERDLRDAVQAAHDAGDSWAAISAVLGTSRQAAHRKFAKPTAR